VINNLQRRVWEHKKHLISGFSQKYDCSRLVYAEEHRRIEEAIEREKQIKNWNRKKKEKLIKIIDPGWVDLYLQWMMEEM
jgi:putative endonuclease